MTNPSNPLKEENPLGEPCLRAPKCEMKARTRGLCDACYRTATHVIRKYKLTWEKLVKHGKAKEATRRPTDREAWFIDWKKPRGRKARSKK